MRQRPEVYVRGVTALSQTKYVVVSKSDCSAWVPHKTFAKNEKAARNICADQGVVLIGSEWKPLVEQVANLESFPSEPVAEHPGWIGTDFLLRNGEAITLEDGRAPRVVFDVDPQACLTSGTLQGFLDGVIEPLRGQHLPMLMMFAAFAAPLHPLTGRVENFGIQVVGKGGTGKSTVLRLAAALCGANYWTSFNTTLEALEQKFPLFHSMPMFIDEVNLFYAECSAAVRGGKLKAVAFRLASGDVKSRWGENIQGRVPLIFATSGNDTLEELMDGGSKATSKAAIDRLMTLKVADDRKHGVFEFVPPSYKGCNDFAQSLDVAAEANAGHVMRAFLKRLVAHRNADEEALKSRIKADMDLFREKAGIGQDNGSMARVGDAFGLLYAGGTMARRYGILPEDYPVGPAVLFCYRHLLEAAKPPLSFDQLFAEFLAKDGVYDVDARGLRRMGDRLFARTTAFLKTNRKGVLEVLVREDVLDAAAPGWLKLIQTPGTRCILDRDKDHITKKRTVRLGVKDERVVVVQISKDFLKA